MKSQKHFELANNIAGNAFVIFSISYFLAFYITDEYTTYTLIGWPSGVIFFVFFTLLIVFVELKLKRLNSEN